MAPTTRPEVATLLLRHGYAFSSRARRAAGAGPPTADPAVRVRMLGRPALLVGGAEGVRAFTDTTTVRREGAVPPVVADVLFGAGAVHHLDDEAHHRRKELFVQALDADAADRMVELVGAAWHAWVATVRHDRPLVVHDEAVRVIGSAVLEWAGIHASPAEAARVARWFAQEVDGFGVLGPDNLRARAARRHSDRWARDLVARVRSGALHPPDGSALALAARWPDTDGRPLPERVAAVDLQNLLRPAVAVARFVAFGAIGLSKNPRWAARVREEHVAGPPQRPIGDRGPTAVAVAREVRRLAPFVPLLAAVVREDGTVLGHRVKAGERLLLDVVGTLRDPLVWDHPLGFQPDRFLHGDPPHLDVLVPQGGGSVVSGHRCPGEDPVLRILAGGVAAVSLLDAEVVSPSLEVDERRLPARPADGVRLRPRFVRETHHHTPERTGHRAV